jgi:hypothetical protein
MVKMDELLQKIEKYTLQLKTVQGALKNILKSESDSNKRFILLENENKKLGKFLSEYNMYKEIPSLISVVLEDTKKEIASIESTMKTRFGSNLNSLLQQKGLKLEGNYPIYRSSLFTIKIDFLSKNAEIFYGPEIESLIKCKPIPEDVATAIFQEHEKISQRSFKDEDYLAQLFESYQIALLHLKQQIGSEVSIGEMVSALAFVTQSKKYRQNPKRTTYTEYDRVFFSYDISRLKSRKINNLELKLTTATRAQTRNRYDFIWIARGGTFAEGEVISGIKFIEVFQ